MIFPVPLVFFGGIYLCFPGQAISFIPFDNCQSVRIDRNFQFKVV